MILDFLFPKLCLECKKEGKYICDNCIEKVLDGTFDKNNFAIFKYKGVIRKAIVSIKYKFATDIVDELVSVSVKRLNTKKYHDVLLVPVPLFWQRENWRGFNQAEIIGEKIAKEMKWNFKNDLVVRKNKTTPQASLKREERIKNLNNVFDINPDCKLNKTILNSNVIIFDDVYTTGSTIKEVKKVLNEVGFKKIYSLTIAR